MFDVHCRTFFDFDFLGACRLISILLCRLNCISCSAWVITYSTDISFDFIVTYICYA
jgi:hypothetical protein